MKKTTSNQNEANIDIIFGSTIDGREIAIFPFGLPKPFNEFQKISHCCLEEVKTAKGEAILRNHPKEQFNPGYKALYCDITELFNGAAQQTKPDYSGRDLKKITLTNEQTKVKFFSEHFGVLILRV